jgi:hypothetical protein
MTYGYIDTDKVRELAAQGLNAKKIPLANGSIKLVNVDGVKMPIGEACALRGFTRESMYQYRSHRGLDLQDGFDAYVIYMQTKTATETINKKSVMLLFRHKLQPIQTIKSILGLGEGFLMFMRQNKYKQQAFDRYLYTRGIK